MIKKIVLDGLTIHDITDASVPYAVDVDGLKGLAEPTFRIGAEDRSGEDGGYLTSAFLGMRSVQASGRVKGEDAATFALNRRALEVRAAIVRDSNSRPQLKTLEITTLNDDVLQVEGIVRKLVVGVVHNNFAPFMFEMLSPDPQLFGSDELSSGQVGLPVSSGAPFPWVFDSTIEFGATSGGDIMIDNPGTTDSWPLVTLRGPLTNPMLRHMDSGLYVQLNAVLIASDVVVVDMKQKTFVLNGVTNYLSKRTEGSNWFSLQPGNNPMKFTSGSTSDTGTAEVTVRPGYMGL